MAEDGFNLPAWLERIGYTGPLQPTLSTLASVVTASSRAIPYENIDVLLGQPPKLDIKSLQDKMVTNGRGGFCFEQTLLLRAGLRAMGFAATGLLARVILGLPADSERIAAHGAVRIDLPEGPFLVDVGFGNLTPTAPLRLCPNVKQDTPHEPMRFVPFGDELVLQAERGGEWINLYRLCNHVPLDADYLVSNWFVSTHPGSLFPANMIAARPGPARLRHTFLNGRVSLRQLDGSVQRTQLTNATDAAAVLRDTFNLNVADEMIDRGWVEIERRGLVGTDHPFFQG